MHVRSLLLKRSAVEPQSLVAELSLRGSHSASAQLQALSFDKPQHLARAPFLRSTSWHTFRKCPANFAAFV